MSLVSRLPGLTVMAVERFPRAAREQAGRASNGAGLALIQGLYFLVAGLWPLFSIRTFQAVTGPKTDLWLVKTVGVLVAVIGAVLTKAGLERRVPADTAALAIGSAAGLAGIEVVYVARGRIARVYLLDAVLEALIIGLWARRRPPRGLL